MSANNPLVSIIMPAYNAEKYIAESIESVLNQTYKNWELLITDDGSTDQTSNIIKSFNDNRIYLTIQKNRGVSAARNVGLSMVQGEYITFLDADDILPFNSLESRVNHLELYPDVDLVDGKALVKNENVTKTIRVHDPSYRGSLLTRLIELDSRVFLTCYYMFRRNILKETRFQEDMTHSEDILFFIELSASQDVQYSYVPETVFLYRVGHVSAMANLTGLEKGYLSLIKKVIRLNNITIFQKIFLRFKISRILFLSWLRKKEIIKAFKSAIRAITIV